MIGMSPTVFLTPNGFGWVGYLPGHGAVKSQQDSIQIACGPERVRYLIGILVKTLRCKPAGKPARTLVRGHGGDHFGSFRLQHTHEAVYVVRDPTASLKDCLTSHRTLLESLYGRGFFAEMQVSSENPAMPILTYGTPGSSSSRDRGFKSSRPHAHGMK